MIAHSVEPSQEVLQYAESFVDLGSDLPKAHLDSSGDS